MILTITLNPSVDISYKLDQFVLDTTNRVQDVSKTAGGKGLNVARVLQQLNEDVAASGFLGGSLGGFIRNQLGGTNIHDFFVDISGETRNCIAIIHEDMQSEVLESGPVITEIEKNAFVEKFKKNVETVDYITVSGSLPKGLPDNLYHDLITIAGENQAKVILDTKGTLLKATLQQDEKPFVIKPNQEELADMLETSIVSEQDIVKALQSPLFAGVEWIAVTLGADGALVKHGDVLYRATIPTVKAMNPVGSGDSVIAGFAAGLSRNLGDRDLIKFALSMGTLNAMEEKTGHINPDKIDWCMDQIKVEVHK